jgi:voltage-gated sodium channel
MSTHAGVPEARFTVRLLSTGTTIQTPTSRVQLAAVSHRPRQLVRLVESPLFDGLVLAVIIANAVVLGLETYRGVTREHSDTLHLLNEVFLGIFVVELALRIASYGRRPLDFFRSGWNVFDFVVVGLAFVPGLRSNSTLLRLARLARVIRVVRLLPDLRILLTGVLRSLPPLFSMALLTTLILFVYGMVGWTLFGDELPGDWGTIGSAMLTLFVMLTLENFPIYMEAGMEVHPWAWVYFVSFVLVAAFIVLNVLIGIVLNSMEEAREIERRRALGDTDPPRHPAPVAERIAILRAALDELEEELAKR